METAGTKTAKNIVLCSDGTGNRGGKARGTNVWATFRAIERDPVVGVDGKPVRQIAFYEDGVGTQKFLPVKMICGAIGFGVHANIKQLYRTLVNNYDVGDRLYLFGFSRGAYTVRSLAGFISRQGVLNRHAPEFKSSRQLDAAIAERFMAYRKGCRARPRHGAAEQSGDAAAKKIMLSEDRKVYTNVRIAFVGVWDTVDAIGLPMLELTTLFDKFRHFRFRDKTPPVRVERAAHAIAIDDERRTFWPVLWDEHHEEDAARVEQVWFAGVHSNVGGGYPKEQMAYVALDWMWDRAEKAGLEFQPPLRKQIRAEADVNGRQYNDSRAGAGAYYRYRPRPIEDLCKKAHIEEPKIHQSVFRRIVSATEDYAPPWIPTNVTVIGDGRSLFDAAEVEEAVRRTGAARAERLEVAKGWVATRSLLYYCFVWATVLFLGFIAGAAIGWWPYTPWVIIAAAVLGALMLGLKSKLEKETRIASLDAWRELRDIGLEAVAKRRQQKAAAARASSTPDAAVACRTRRPRRLLGISFGKEKRRIWPT